MTLAAQSAVSAGGLTHTDVEVRAFEFYKPFESFVPKEIP